MHTNSLIEGVVAKQAHPAGCEQFILRQIQYAQSASQIQHGPKRVLILGSSSGLGLAARIALTFGGAGAKTIGVSLDTQPRAEKSGNAGYYNNLYFKQYAEKAGYEAINIQGDVFSQTTKDEVIEAIETYFDGEVDLIIYSIASGKRKQPDQDEYWRAVLKPTTQSVTCPEINFATDLCHETTIKPATEDEIHATLKVMGGEAWESWVDTLINSESIAPGCQTIAFSYVGSPLTYPIYLNGTLGMAKVDLHQTSHALNLKLANFDGGAYAVVCKALMTRASVCIPGLLPYLMMLSKVLDQRGTNENCNQQMQRLFTDKLYGPQDIQVDSERLIRLDEYELSPQVQESVRMLLHEMRTEKLTQQNYYHKMKAEFMQLNGFGWQQSDDVTEDVAEEKTESEEPLASLHKST
ncbi:trans-2-enoyl-CoA reductase family protein [Vibrio quintilis]|nr:trans-2-enoyl-CoA reductase family protein [Vibrio quintilis]